MTATTIDLAGCAAVRAGERGGDSAGGEDMVSRHFLRRGHGVEFEMEAQWFRSHLPAEARRVVDVGCGGGALLPVIGLRRVIGIDLRGGGLKLTRKRFAETPLLCGAAERLPLEDGTADAITLQHVLEHLSTPEAAFREWFRVLKPGGVLLIQTPNAAFVDPRVFEDPTHVHVFSAYELGRDVELAGFEILDLRTLGLPWFRGYAKRPGGWRLRRLVTGQAALFSKLGPLRWRGQTLCCAAQRPMP